MDSSKDLQTSFLASLTPNELRRLVYDWELWARPDQLPPEGDWISWLVLGGRGAGKTRTGAEWVKALVQGRMPFATQSYGRIALIGETLQDARDVMVEGVSGLLAIHDIKDRPNWRPSRRRLEWPNGAVAQIFSAEDPESLRGPQFDAAWGDELAKWRHAEATWDMLQFGLRLGQKPRQIVTTTPKPTPLLKRLMADPSVAISHAPTRTNLANLAPGFLDTIVRRYEGSRLGRQELDGELIEDRADALWKRDQLDRLRARSVSFNAESAPTTSQQGAAFKWGRKEQRPKPHAGRSGLAGSASSGAGFPWASIFAMASRQLGWTPSAIWAATPEEVLMALTVPARHSASMSREDFQMLSAAFPD